MQKNVFFLIILIFLFLKPTTILASGRDSNEKTNFYDDIKYDEIQKVMDDILGKNQGFNFGEYVERLMSGKSTFSITSIWKDVKTVVKIEINANKNVIIHLISIAIIAAVFTNFTNIFKNNQVAETGFYVTYLLLFSILTTSFYTVSLLAGETLSKLLTFMKVLLPAYFMSVAFSSGTTTSLLYYQSTLFLITVVDMVLVRIIIPLINIYFVLVLANNLSKEDMLSRLTELFELVIEWTLKTIFSAIIGFNGIQGLIIPVADRVKNSMLLKATGAIPGVGNSLSSVSETVYSVGVLVKNSIGVAGLIVIILICLIPLVKLVLFVLIYKFGVAIVQPISDKRIMNCMNASAQSARLLLFTVFIGTILFLITIAIISAGTNLNLT